MPKIILSKDVMSVTDFARGTKELLADLSRHQRPRVLTQNGKAAAVVMSVEAYEAMAQDAEEHRLDVQLKAAMEAYAKGERGRPLDEVVSGLRSRLFKPEDGE